MKALITGVHGFVGKYLKEELAGNGYEVVGTDLTGSDIVPANFLDPESVADLLRCVRPDVIFHLAGQASVALSWKIPRKTFDINVGGTINLLETIHALSMSVKVLVVGSSDQYGNVRPKDCPIRETLELKPQSPYAISKEGQEKIALALAKMHHIPVVLTRSFNHIGPGQKKGFVLPDFADSIVQIERNAHPAVLRVGNLEAERDFTDVRDVVRAYRMLIEKGKAGEVYNIGSGTSFPISHLLDELLKLTPAQVQVEPDPARMRISDIPLIRCCYDKLREDTGWKPIYPLRQTLQDTLDYFRHAAE